MAVKTFAMTKDGCGRRGGRVGFTYIFLALTNYDKERKIVTESAKKVGVLGVWMGGHLFF